MVDPVELLEGADTIAVVGCSRHPEKDAHRIPKILQGAGFRVIPVNPHADEILGEKAYDTVDEIGEPIDIVDAFRPAGEAPEVARRAVKAGARALWLQLGITSAEARQIAEDAGLAYVEDECTGATVRRHGIASDSPSNTRAT